MAFSHLPLTVIVLGHVDRGLDNLVLAVVVLNDVALTAHVLQDVSLEAQVLILLLLGLQLILQFVLLGLQLLGNMFSDLGSEMVRLDLCACSAALRSDAQHVGALTS